MHPVLEHLAALDGVGHHCPIVRTESCEKWQLLTPHQDVDGVDLQQTDV